ncbi:MAG: hypothetical protein AAF479_15640 [Pseudomonadota bacterium]
MGFTPIKVARRMTGGPGIKASCTDHEVTASRVVTISFNRDAQKRYFSREIDPENDRFHVMRGTETDAGKVMFQVDPEGEVRAVKSMHNSIRFKLQAFPPVPSEAVKSLDCIVISSKPELKEVVIRVPWNDGSRK